MMKIKSKKVIAVALALALVFALMPGATSAIDLTNAATSAPSFNIGETVTFGAPITDDSVNGTEMRSQWKKFTVTTPSILTIKLEVEPGQVGEGAWYYQLKVWLVRPDGGDTVYDWDNKRDAMEALGDKNLTDTGIYKVLPGTYYLKADGGYSGHTGYGKVTVTAQPVTVNPQWSDNMVGAKQLDFGKEYTGVIAYDGYLSGSFYYTLDEEYYKIKTISKDKLKITVSRADVAYDNYIYVKLIDGNGNRIGDEFDIRKTAQKTVTIPVPKAGTYYLEIADGTGGRATEFTVKVISTAATKVTLNKTKLTLKKGKAAELKATLAPSTATPKTITWSSDKKSVVTVDKNGKLKAVGKGTATITAKSWNGKKATCKITVN